jgi:putative membrane protein
MYNGKISHNLLKIALVTLACGPVAAYAQSTRTDAGVSKSAATQKDASSGSENASVSAGDQKLMRELAYANLSEIEAAKLAQSKSQNEQVKSFAQKMIDDHTKAQAELQQLAQAKGVKLPDSPDVKHKVMATAMKALSGDTFDKRYLAQGGLQDHQAAHDLLQRTQSEATDPELKKLAAKMQPTVDKHLATAKQLQDTQKSSGSSASGSTGSGSTSSGSANK